MTEEECKAVMLPYLANGSLKCINHNIKFDDKVVTFQWGQRIAKYIRGFVTPKYSSKATKEEAPKPSGNGGGSYNIGDIVNFTGCLHYTSSTASGGPMSRFSTS